MNLSPQTTWRRRLSLRVISVALSIPVTAVFTTASVSAQSTPEPTFVNGFATLASALGDDVGRPLEPEHPGPEPGSIVQRTSKGLAYWSPEHVATFTDGHRRAALTADGEVVRWEGNSLDPPPPQRQATVAPPSVIGYAAYIAAHSRYGQRAVCVSRIETGGWTAFYNPTPVGREHAQGFFGWLPSTANPIGVRIMDIDSEIAGFDHMLDVGRGNEFYGISARIC